MSHDVASYQYVHCLLMYYDIKFQPVTSYYLPTLNGFLATSEDPDEMQHAAAFHQGLYCLLRLKQPAGTEYIIIKNFLPVTH